MGVVRRVGNDVGRRVVIYWDCFFVKDMKFVYEWWYLLSNIFDEEKTAIISYPFKIITRKNKILAIHWTVSWAILPKIF